MAGALSSSISICPINFKEFNKINLTLKNLEASLLFSKIKFHENKSQIKKSGKTWIARSREQMAAWFGFTPKKLDRLLSLLEKHNLIEKKAGLWYGNKKLFISTHSNLQLAPVNISVLNTLVEYIGSLKLALIFSKIAFALANSKLQHEGLTWCCIKKEELSLWSGISIRSLDKLISELEKKKLILKKNFSWKGRLQTHFHIPQNVIEDLIKHIRTIKLPQNDHQEISSGNEIEAETDSSKQCNSDQTAYIPNCRPQSANKVISLKPRTKLKKTNNNTANLKESSTKAEKNSDINFCKIAGELSFRQINYLRSALNNTIQRKQLSISSPKELWEQIKFSLLNPQQLKGVCTFQHAVSRCMKILSDGNWRTPIGFYNHSAAGTAIKQKNHEKLQHWETEKTAEGRAAQSFFSLTQLNHFMNAKKAETQMTQLNQQALAIATQISRLSQHANAQNQHAAKDLMQELFKQLERLLRQGADKATVMQYLKSTNFKASKI